MIGASKMRRKQYLINPGFQWKVAGTIAVAVFLFSILISITLYGTLHGQARLRASNPTGYTAEVTSVMIWFGLGFAAITAGGVGLWSILMTHRICGPMFVMKRYLLQVAEGKLPAIRPLRKRDEFKDLYDAFDQALATLRAGKQKELMQLNAAIENVRQVHSTATASAKQDIQAVLERLESLRAKAQDTLADSQPAGQQHPACTAAAAPQMA